MTSSPALIRLRINNEFAKNQLQFAINDPSRSSEVRVLNWIVKASTEAVEIAERKADK